MILTREMVLAGRSKRGGWTRAQLKTLGVAWPPRQGWLDALSGTEVSEAVYERFMALQKSPPETGPVNLAARYRRELGLPPLPGDDD